MAIRDKIRAKFSKKGSPPNDGPIETHYTGRTDIEYYKPNEIPKSKYRSRVDPAHQTKLNSYSFEDAFQAVRRPSAALSGTFSPGGTKALSRRTSYNSHLGGRTPVRSRRSSLSSDANNSFSIPSSESASTYIRRLTTAPTTNSTLTGATRVGSGASNTGLFKLDTFNQVNDTIPCIRLDKIATKLDSDNDALSSHIEHTRTSGDMPFSPEQLTQAISQATIKPQITARRVSVAPMGIAAA